MTAQPDDNPTLTPHALDTRVATTTLANGMKVIIKEDARSPVVICHVWVKIGSNGEPDNLRGWAHGIEHMVFKGTATRSEGDFAREVAEIGGSTNAGTGYETTSYHITLPSEHLGQACTILGDALFGASFAPDALDAERQVLVHENHMYDDIPAGFGVTWRWVMELAFDRSPYRHPIGGRDEVLLETPRADILGFFRAAYRPDNMTVVIVGDVAAKDALALVQKSFTNGLTTETVESASAITLPEPPCDAAQTGIRYRLVQGDIQKAYAKLLFHGPSEQSSRRTTLSVIKRILGDGRSSRLYREVQEKRQLVSSIAAMSEAGPREGIFMVDLETDVARLAEALVASVAELERLAGEPVSAAELERAQTRVLRSFRFNSETMQGQAANLGYFDAMDDLEGAFVYPERVQAIGPEDLSELSRAMFRRGNLSCLVYLPADCDPQAAGIPADSAQLDTLLQDALADAPPPKGDWGGPAVASDEVSITRTPARSSVPTPRSGEDTSVADGFERATLAGGTKVYLRPDHSLPVVAMALYARGGACGESAAVAGRSALAQLVQVKGADGRDAEALYGLLEGQGASLVPQIDRDYSGLFATALAERLEEVLPLVGAVACRPSWLQIEIDQERRLALENLRAIADDPFQYGALRLREMMYGDHPYGRPLVGTEQSLPGLDRDLLVSHHELVWRPENLHLVVSGDFEPEALLATFNEILADLPAGSPADCPDLSKDTGAQGVQTAHLARDQHQSVVLAAWPGPSDPNADRVPLLLWNGLLNGQDGVLFEALRNRRSLCYSTGVMAATGYGPGLIAGYLLTAPESEQDARQALVDEIVRSAESVPAEAEFQRAKAKLIGNLLISNQSHSARVARCGRDVLYGRDANDLPTLVAAIRACPPEMVRAAAAKYIDPDNRYEVTVGPSTD